jgi:outer membrane receptor protein involved in Fe transport
VRRLFALSSMTVSLIGVASVCCAQSAETSGEDIDQIIVWGRGENLIGSAQAASEGSVGGADLAVRPMLRVAELLEVVPGLIAAQHSGSGKANQYFLRGFNLDHGTDFTSSIDDVPLNLRSHGHGQGYLDVNGLIPETIERIDFRKGPYRADSGDFSLAGASFLHTVDRFETPFISAERGAYGWQRLAGGGTVGLGSGELTFAAQAKTYDGPWEEPEQLKHESFYTKYVDDIRLGALQVSLSGYRATWHPTEQIPERVIGSDVCANAFCALDPTALGLTERFIATAHLAGDQWQATAYAQHYNWHMLSNPTYDYQINQFDRRWTFGGRFQRDWHIASSLTLSTGVESRYDSVGNVGVEHTDLARFVEHISQHAIDEGSLALYTEANWTPIEHLRVIAGLRADTYDFEVKAKASDLAEGHESTAMVSPKVALAYELTRNLELYANWGRGFHSNDARGVVNKETPVPGLVRGEGREVGARLQAGDWSFTATYWQLDLESELKFVGDSNSVEPSNPTHRSGYELVGFYHPLQWLAFDLSFTRSHARFLNQPGEDHVPGALENAGEFGVSLSGQEWEAGVRLRHLGGYPIIEDNSQRATAENVVNVRLAWKPGHFMVYGEVLNVLGDDGKDIVYYYGTNVRGFDSNSDQVDGRISRAEEPRTVRVGLSYRF